MRNTERIKKAISRLDSAEFSILFLMNEKKGYNRKAIRWNLQKTLFEIRNARTLLKNLEYTQLL
jgi:hypothetical protein